MSQESRNDKSHSMKKNLNLRKFQKKIRILFSFVRFWIINHLMVVFPFWEKESLSQVSK